MNKDLNTEGKILQAAREAFTRKGLAGARMQDIADEAGINKALVHYYFESKEKLFDLVFEQEFIKFFSNLVMILSADITLFDKIRQIVSLDIERLSQFPGLPIFILNEISRNEEVISMKLKKLPVKNVMAGFRKQINTEIRNGNIRKISSEQLLINIQSLSIFPFIARPMLKTVLEMNESNFKTMIGKRKIEVAEFIINAIKK